MRRNVFRSVESLLGLWMMTIVISSTVYEKTDQGRSFFQRLENKIFAETCTESEKYLHLKNVPRRDQKHRRSSIQYNLI